MIENEQKFVLNPHIEEYLAGLVDYIIIEQCYLTDEARIRKWQPNRGGGSNPTYEFTFKMKLNDGHVEEITSNINEQEYHRLASSSKSRLRKNRYKFSGDDGNWDVDLFKDVNHSTYFALAECEFSSGQSTNRTVHKMPKLIEANLIYAVPRDKSSEYSSLMLCDTDYASGQLTLLKLEEQINETTT